MPSHRNTHTDEMQAVMAPRRVLRRRLCPALVSCPIALHAMMRASDGLHLHFIDRGTAHRVHLLRLFSEIDEEVTHRDLATPCAFSMNRYLLLDEEDFEQARIATSSTMTVGRFVDG